MKSKALQWCAIGAVYVGVSVALAPPAVAKSCADFDSQAEAQKHLRNNPRDPDNLDPDNNGIACENAPSPQDTTPVRHVDSSGSTIPLRQDSATTTPAGGVTATTSKPDGSSPSPTDRDNAKNVGEDATTSTSEFDTTDSTSTLTRNSDAEGVSTGGVVGTLVGLLVFAGIYVWIRRR